MNNKCDRCDFQLVNGECLNCAEPAKKSNRMYYFYISLLTPLGPSAMYYKDKLHPLDPNSYKTHTASLASKMSIQSGKSIIPESIIYMSLHELPQEVIEVQFPV